MRVTFIYAGIGVAGFRKPEEKTRTDREGALISHGVGSIVASTKQAGFEVDFIDMRQLTDWDDLENIIQKSDSLAYGISISAVDYASGLKIISIIKTLKPQAKVIVGGIHPTVMPEMYDFKVIDTVVRGEGEITFPDLLNKILNKEELPRQIQGVKPDLNAIPFVDREIFDYRQELNKYFAGDHELPTVTMLAGRGCPYHCKYCQPAENAVFGKPHRMRSPENVMEELYQLKRKYRFRSITFWDDTFTFSPKWIMKFADLYERSQFGGQIAACSRADIICNQPAMIKRMAEIGVNWLVVGMESGSQRILDLIGKGTTVEQNKECVKICHEYGIKVFATIMYGLPTETNEEVNQTNAMLDESNVDHISPFWYVPIPGTKLYDFCQDRDLILNADRLGQTVERTGKFVATLKGVDYPYLADILNERMCAA